jgi:Sad1 / UNC-like C-terminal
MLKASSEARNRCYLHPHRLAAKRCERCRTGLCADCTRTYRGQILCQNCADEVELAFLSIPTFKERVVERLTSLRNTMIVVAIVVAVSAGAFLLLRPLMNQPISPEEFARFRYAASGGFQTAEGVNANSTVLGAKVVSATSERLGFEAKHLINEYTGAEYPGWRSATATFPQDIVVSHDQITTVSKVILFPQTTETSATRVKHFEIAVSNDGPDTGFITVGAWDADQSDGLQRFTFPSTTSKWIRLRILSNYGSTDYTSLDEFDAYSASNNPLTAPTATATP